MSSARVCFSKEQSTAQRFETDLPYRSVTATLKSAQTDRKTSEPRQLLFGRLISDAKQEAALAFVDTKRQEASLMRNLRNNENTYSPLIVHIIG